MQGAFDLKVNEYKEIKGLEKENLRDHMTDLELIITMLDFTMNYTSFVSGAILLTRILNFLMLNSV